MRCKSVSTVTMLRAGRPGFHSRHEQRLFLFATASREAAGTTQPRVSNGYYGLFRRGGGQWVNLTTHIHLEPRLRMRGSVSPILHTFTFTFTFNNAMHHK